ncbi:amp dependent CoA ligase [Coprinopsis marcescibilis]|uniref:Amp dependent CoA ligase n=1 Tax=Coprinopsis marcescibilis TaxID=230819 RepID=A0A5C3L4E9_COPMA|nr:amp dependent CoA ligase [Coprinopsis marcescibilis]
MVFVKSPYPEPPAFPQVNAHHILFKRPDQAAWPDFTLHIDAVSGQRRKYSEFVAHMNDLATALGAPSPHGLGFRKEGGEIVGIMMENSSDYIALLQACIIITTPFALISSYSTAFELKHALTLSKATSLFVDAKFLPIVLPVAKEVGMDLSRIFVGRGNAPGRKSIVDLVNDVRAKSVPFIGIRPATKDTLAYLVFSSGTSGLPKAVMISHGNLIYSIGQAAVMGQINAQVYTPPPPVAEEGLPVVLAFLPLHHTYGLHSYSYRAFLAPGTLVIMDKWDIDVALRCIPQYKVSGIALIPSIVHQLVHHPKIEQVDLSSVTQLGSGAAYLPPSLADKLSKLIAGNASFSEGYGMSECTIAAITQPVEGALGGKLKRIPGCTGVLLPGMDGRTVRDDGTEADINETGELWLRSPNVALGYWNNEKADKETFVDGWLKTGDKFSVDKDGNFWFADRSKDTLKVSGAQVSPMEIENVLIAHPDKLIIDVTVAGVSGGRTSDEKVPRAWVVLSAKGKGKGAAVTIKALEKWSKANLSKYKHLRGGIGIVDEIPKSPTGKVLRRILQEQYEKAVVAAQQENVRAKL